MLMRKGDKSLKISAPRERTLHGVRIHKLPVGKYIQVLRALEDLPSLLMGEVFPELRMKDILSTLQQIDKDGLLAIMGRLLTIVPEQVCTILSDLLDIPLDKLLDADAPGALGINELAQILLAFWELNDMTDFFTTVRRLQTQASAQNIGFSGSSQSHKA